MTLSFEQQMFEILDKDKDGKITFADIAAHEQKLAMEDGAKCEEAYAGAGASQDGLLNFEAFGKMMQAYREADGNCVMQGDPMEAAKQMFAMLDTNKDNFVSHDEIKAFKMGQVQQQMTFYKETFEAID